MENEINTSGSQPQEQTQPAQAEDKPAEKLFTQEEVNEIIRKRLAKEKAKAQQTQPQDTKPEQLTDAELLKRSNYLDCKEYVLNNSLSVDLLEVLDTSDFAAFKEKADMLQKITNESAPAYPFVHDGGELLKISDPDAEIKQAFSKSAAHIPKQFNSLTE
jgi:hypothetical protein